MKIFRRIVEQLSFSRLFNLSEPKRIVRSNTVKGPPLDIRAFDDAQYYIFNFKSNPSTTGLRHHGYIKFLRPRKDDEPLSELPCLVDCTCVSGDTLVLMGDGMYKAIQDIRDGDSVYTHKGRIRPVIGNVERKLKEKETVYSVSVAGFSLPITVTGSHPFYVLTGKITDENPFSWVKVDDFREKEWLLTPKMEHLAVVDFNSDLSIGQGHLRAMLNRVPSSYIGTVWDLCVEEDHSFIVHGVAVQNCEDYRYRFAWANKQRGAGVVGPRSLNQAINRAPRITNPSAKPQLCKHVLALKNYIQGLMWDIPKSGLKSSDDVLSNLVKYATKRSAEGPQQKAAAKARDARFAAMKSLTRSGQPQPSPEDLPDIPASEDPGSEVEQDTQHTSDNPELPDTPEQASKMVPPTLHVNKPEKRRRQESQEIEKVDKLCIMISLTKEINTIRSLIEDEQRLQTPPTEGEASHSQALDLLRSIDKGIQTLNAGIQELTADIKTDADESDPATDLNEPELPQDDPQAGGNDAANLEKELSKLGVPQR